MLIAILKVGAGIRVPPNSSRLSLSWGVDFSNIKKVTSAGNRFVDWQNNTLLDVPLDNVQEEYGAPYYFIHRADLVNALIDAAKKRPNITLRTDCRVAEYDFYAPFIRTEKGEAITGDVVICADGIKSAIRDTINRSPAKLVDTGDVAYRILVPAAPLLKDPSMSHLVTEPWATHWLGPEGHAVGYPLRGQELYNIILDITHKTDLGEPVGEAEWKSARDNDELVKRFKDWNPTVGKLCAMTGTYLKWKLMDLEKELDHWVHESGKVALLGDACHPMMPYLAQGAAQATEDAGTLRTVLREFDSIPEALKEYERQRKPRGEYIAKNTRVMQEWLHLYDGPARDERDRLMKKDSPRNPIYWGNKERKDWLFGYNAEKLLSADELRIPELPPLPPSDASVYSREHIGADGRRSRL